MVEVQLLGEQRVAIDGEIVGVGRATRMLGLLGYLIVHAGAPQLRQHVAGLFWPDSTDAQARTNLRRELHRLRSTLPASDRCLALDDNTVTWRTDAPCTVDLVEFRSAVAAAEHAAERIADDRGTFVAAAERALRIYGGDLLPGLYDDWVLTERDQLRRSCAWLIDQLVPALVERGDIDTAIARARRRTELEPLDESGYRRLMSLQAQAGDRAAALRTFHTCSSALERELGVEPSAETTAVYEDLRARSRQPEARASSLRSAARLIGRDAELSALHRIWVEAAESPTMVVVAGEAGVGKTRAVSDFADAVEREGAIVARARCFAARGGMALSPVVDWLRSPVLARAANRLDPVWRTAAARLVPELRVGDEVSRPMPLTDAWQRGHFLEGLARAVLATDLPTLLVLDDLHWCDAQTLEWLEVLLHLRPDVPLLVAATVRSEEFDRSIAAATFCRRLRATGVLRELELAPLGTDEVSELVASLGAGSLDAAAARRLHRQTGGFPLFVVESLRGGTTGPSRVDAILSARLAQLTSPADELAGVAAAVGRDFSLELLGAVSGLAVDVVVDGVDQMWRGRLLRESSPTTYDFTHDLLRDAAYQQLTSPHRRMLHRRIAAALESQHADAVDLVAGQIAEQHESGGQRSQAIDFHVLAAGAASAVFAHDDAVAHYERALALLGELPAEPARQNRELAVCDGMLPSLLALVGYGGQQVGDTLERMLRLGEQLGDDAVVVSCQTSLAAHLFVQGKIRESHELTSGLVARIDDYPEQVGQIAWARSFGLVSLGRLEEGLELFERIERHSDVTELSLLGFPVRVMGTGWAGHVQWLTGRSSQAAASAAAAVELADEFDHPYSRTIAQAYSAITQRLLGDVDVTVEQALAVRRLCDRYGFAYYGEWGRILEGWATGGAPGESLIRDGLDRLRANRAGARMPFWLALLSEVLTRGGRVSEARRVLADARAWAQEHGDLWWLAEICRLDAGGRTDAEANPLLERALAIAGEQGAVALELRAATDLAGRRLDGGHPEAAEALLRPVRDRAGDCNRADVAAADRLFDAITT